MQSTTPKDVYKRSRILFVAEQTLEYFISMLITGAYLARLTAAIGLSDDVTGILSAIASIAGIANLLALTLMNRRSVKRIVTIGHTVNQLLFAFLYLIPFIPVPPGLRTLLLCVSLLFGYIISSSVSAPKITWFMALVDDRKRGIYTANKEIVSLLSGMLFTFIMGGIIDYFDAKGNQSATLLFLSAVVFTLSILHTMSLLFSKEKTVSEEAIQKERVRVKDLVSNKKLLKILPVTAAWALIYSTLTPFLGTYQNKELGFSMLFISAISAIASLMRAVFSRPMGRFADKYSFSSMLVLCFSIQALALALNTFTVPANGRVLFTLYAILNCISMAGINSALINLVYDYVPGRMRTASLAFQSILNGLVGFLTTLIASRLVAYIQKSGNRFLGLSAYSQQVLSALALLFCLLTILYLCLVVRRIKRTRSESDET
ncbi:MAG: MFS transporter [Clostridia bacterium]|nr:MFS transporter [Clostridia bacterium]